MAVSTAVSAVALVEYTGALMSSRSALQGEGAGQVVGQVVGRGAGGGGGRGLGHGAGQIVAGDEGHGVEVQQAGQAGIAQQPQGRLEGPLAAAGVLVYLDRLAGGLDGLAAAHHGLAAAAEGRLAAVLAAAAVLALLSAQDGAEAGIAALGGKLLRGDGSAHGGAVQIGLVHEARSFHSLSGAIPRPRREGRTGASQSMPRSGRPPRDACTIKRADTQYFDIFYVNPLTGTTRCSTIIEHGSLPGFSKAPAAASSEYGSSGFSDCDVRAEFQI